MSKTNITFTCIDLSLTLTYDGKDVTMTLPGDDTGIPGEDSGISEITFKNLAEFNRFAETVKDFQRTIANQIHRPTLSSLITPHSGDEDDSEGEHPHLRMEDC